MKVFSRLAQGTVLTLLATPLAAQITPQDVWDNQMAYMQAIGLTVVAMPQETGGNLTIKGLELTYDVPMGLGWLYLMLPDMTLTANADGTVSVGYPEQSNIVASAMITAEGDSGSVKAEFTLTLQGFASIAAGTPGDITYQSSSGLVDLALGNVNIAPSIEQFDLTAYFTMRELVSTTRITAGDAVVIDTQGTNGATVYDLSFSDETGMKFRSVGGVTSSSATSRIALPNTSSDLMNLAVAFRDGLAFDITSDAVGTFTQTIAEISGTVLSDQKQSVGRTTQTLHLAQDGFHLTTSGTDIAFDMTEPDLIPDPVSLAMSRAALVIGFPISASPAPQPVELGLELRDLTLSEPVWAMFDYSGILPRDPATLAFNLSGNVSNSVDLFDFMSLSELEGQISAGLLPVSLLDLGVTGVEASAVGMSATGEAAFTFDNTDLVTYDGLPRPIGTASATLTGLYAFTDKLVQLGIVTEADVTMMGPGLAMVADLTGEDTLTTAVEMTADGHIKVNGQQIQ